MSPTKHDLERALALYWETKDKQREEAERRGSTAEGTSVAVRGGGHFAPLVNLVAQFFIDAGYPPSSIGAQGATVELPGYYRPTKRWDLVIAHRGVLVAAFEMKALGGPSFGNNYNNRVEEALGSAVDLSRARVARLLGNEQPWLGYFFIMEDHVKSRAQSTRAPRGKMFKEDPGWVGRSYQERFAQTGERLLEEKLYDAVCYVVSSPASPEPTEPSLLIDWKHFSAAIQGRISYLRQLGYP